MVYSSLHQVPNYARQPFGQGLWAKHDVRSLGTGDGDIIVLVTGHAMQCMASLPHATVDL